MRAESGYHEDCPIWESGSKRQNNCRKEVNIMKFEKPKMETVTFDAEDVIVTSGGGKPCDPNWASGCNPVASWKPDICPAAGTTCIGGYSK